MSLSDIYLQQISCRSLASCRCITLIASSFHCIEFSLLLMLFCQNASSKLTGQNWNSNLLQGYNITLANQVFLIPQKRQKLWGVLFFIKRGRQILGENPASALFGSPNFLGCEPRLSQPKILLASSILTLFGSGHQNPAWNLPMPNVQ
jgi:hypothetical protein